MPTHAGATDPVDHAALDDEQVAERYLLGTLDAATATRFEEHALGCPRCLERLELGERLRAGVRRLAVQEAAARAAVEVGLLAAFARLSRLHRWALASAALLLAALPAALLAPRLATLGRELDGARAELAREREAPPEPPAPAAPRREPGEGEQLAAAREAADAERRRLAAELEAEQRRREELAARLDRALAPQVNAVVVALAPLRSGPRAGEPDHRVPLPAAPGWVVLSLEPADPGFPAYRVTLVGPDGAVHWQGAGLVPDAAGALSLALPSTLLPPGEYAARIDGVPPGGEPVPVAEYTFRAIPSAGVR